MPYVAGLKPNVIFMSPSWRFSTMPYVTGLKHLNELEFCKARFSTMPYVTGLKPFNSFDKQDLRFSTMPYVTGLKPQKNPVLGFFCYNLHMQNTRDNFYKKNTKNTMEELLLPLYSNIARSNITNFNKNESFDSNFKNNISFNKNIKNEIKSSNGKSEPLLTKKSLELFFKQEMFTWLKESVAKLRNYYSHVDKQYAQNNERLEEHFDKNEFCTFKKIIKIYLNLDSEALSNSDIIYKFIIISMFLLSHEIKILREHLRLAEKNYNWNRDLETLKYLFSKQGFVNKVSKLRLINKIDKEKIENSSSQIKLDVLHNFFHNLKTESKGNIKFNKLASKLLNQFLDKSPFRFVSLKNKKLTNINEILSKYKPGLKINNFWSIKDKPCNFNYVLVVNIKNDKFKYKLLSKKSLNNLILNLLGKEIKQRNKTINEIIESGYAKTPNNRCKSWKLNSVPNQFKENKNQNKFNSLKTLKMLNKILLTESRIKEIKGEYNSKLKKLNALAPSRNDFFSLKYYIDNKNFKKSDELLKKLYIDKNKQLFKNLKIKQDNILNSINKFIRDYVESNKQNLLNYYNSDWAKDIKVYKKNNDSNENFTSERNKMLLVIKRNKNSKTDDIISDKKSSLHNHIIKWRPILLLANELFDINNSYSLKEFNDLEKIWKPEEFKWIPKSDYINLINNTKKLIGKISLPKEIVDINEDDNIRSNLNIFKSPLYSNFKEIIEAKGITIETKKLIEIVKKYKEKELEIVHKTFRLENNEDKKWLRKAIFHRLEIKKYTHIINRVMKNWESFLDHIDIEIKN